MPRHDTPTVLLAAIALLILATPTSAQPPVVQPGECLYLVGAPSGALAAETEQRIATSRIQDVCTLPAQVDLNRDGENMIQAWIEDEGGLPTSEKACELGASIAHVFRASPDLTRPARAWVSIHGEIRASLLGSLSTFASPAGLVVRASILERSPAGSAVVTSKEVLHQVVSVSETQRLDSAFGIGLTVDLKPDREYLAEIRLELSARVLRLIDAGSPGSDNWVRYTSIEVCTGPGDEDGRLAQDRLEHDLHARACYPGLWLPEEHGGRLEAARTLVETRVAQATAAGSPGVHAAAARRSLARADAHAADGDHQAACRSLVQALHSLTTP